MIPCVGLSSAIYPGLQKADNRRNNRMSFSEIIHFFIDHSGQKDFDGKQPLQ